MAACTVDTEPLRLLARQIAATGKSISPGAQQAVAAVVLQGVKDRLRDKTDWTGKAHRPLSPVWLRQKQKEVEEVKATRRGRGRSTEIWQYTGESIRKVRSRVVRGMIMIYIDTPYSGHADELRPVMGVSEAEFKAISKIVLDDLVRQAFGS